jgi:hypothetical protein
VEVREMAKELTWNCPQCGDSWDVVAIVDGINGPCEVCGFDTSGPWDTTALDAESEEHYVELMAGYERQKAQEARDRQAYNTLAKAMWDKLLKVESKGRK